MSMKTRIATFLLLLCPMLLWAKNYPGQDVFISTKNTTLLLLAKPGETPRVAYYGAKLNERQGSEVWWTNGALNDVAYRTFNGTTDGFPALTVQHADGQIALDLQVQKVSREQAEGGELVTIETKDKVQPFFVALCYRTYEASDVIEAWTEIRHQEKKDVMLLKYASAQLPVTGPDVWVTTFYGEWANEMNVNETKLTHAGLTVAPFDGVRNGHEAHGELMISLDGRSRENAGRTIGAALCWSGKYLLSLASDPKRPDEHRLMAGIDDALPYYLKPGASFRTPELAFTYSAEGRGGVSRNLHDWARHFKVHNGTALRDVLLNSWEGVYLAVNEEKMLKLMKGAADIGGELFVMDDGWFASKKFNRDRDNAALGDWDIDARKLPGGLKPLIEAAKENGIKFGIWIEPEMGNWKASELYEKHPDWFLQNTGREPKLGRGGTQAVLDLCNPKVQDFVFSVFDNTMKLSPNIDYIKWDANRHAENAGSEFLPKDRQSHFWIDYVQGFYKVMERIRAKYPDVLIQACASGGGRVEYGAMKYFNEVWTSDNTEALSRARIQYGTSLFYPATVMGSHVSATPNHQTSNITPIKFRFDMACAGRLGMELQPKQMNAEEKAFARKAIESYKGYRDIVMEGDFYRIGTPYDDTGYYGVMYVSKDKKKAVLFTYCTLYQSRTLVPKFRLYGLDAQTRYKIREQNVDKKRFWFDGGTFTGEYLNHAGINPNLNKIYDSAVFVLEAE